MQHKVKVGVNEDGTVKMMNFRAFLLGLCQDEFERDMNDDEELDNLKHAIDEAQTVSVRMVNMGWVKQKQKDTWVKVKEMVMVLGDFGSN